MLLNKYKVSDEKQESLTDVTMEWSACKINGTKDNLDTWFSELYRIIEKFKNIKREYKKDEVSIKAHVIVHLL